MAILLTCCCAHFASIALSDAGPRELTLLWQRELPNDIEWLALRETDVGPFLLVQTREPRLVLMDALHSGFYAPLVYEPDPGSRLIECSCRSGVPFVVAGRHAVYGVWPRVDRGAEPLDWERRVRVGGFSTGEQFNPARDVPGDPEILRGMVAAGQSDQGILIAGKSRDVVRLDEVNASEQGGFLAAGDVQRIAPGTDGWALLTRERGRYGVTLVETTAQRREMSLYSCDLDDVGPQWFGLVGKSAVCVSPAAVDIIQPFGLWVRFAPDQGRFFIHSTTCVLEGSTWRPLVLVGDSAGSVMAFDTSAAREAWRSASESGRTCVELAASENCAVRVFEDHAEVIDLLTGAPRGSIALPADDEILATKVDGARFFCVSRRLIDGVWRGRLRVWWLSDLSPAGDGEFHQLDERTTAMLHARVLLCRTGRMLTALAIDAP